MIHTRIRRILQGADFSGQEPRLLAQLCGDEGMLAAYNAGKDLYAEIASISLNETYKKCLEHFPKGCPIKKGNDGHWYYAKLIMSPDGEDDIQNFEDLGRYLEEDFDPSKYDYDKLADGDTDVYDDGKERRTAAKRILLGIMYGRGALSIAEQLFGKVDIHAPGGKEKQKENLEKAQAIKNRVYEAFPKIKVFEEVSIEMVTTRGYVTTLWGRKRRLPNYNLPKFEFYYLNEKNQIIQDMPVPDPIKKTLLAKVEKTFKDTRTAFIDKVKQEDRILIVDNGSKIAEAGRQIINSRVQGSASDMSKQAMIKIYRDPELRKRKVKIILPIHDEIIIEVPFRYARKVKHIFEEDMTTAARPKLTIPVSCDVVSSDRWYGDEIDIETELKGLENV